VKKKIVLIGGGDFAKKVIRLIQYNTDYEIIGYTDLSDAGPLFDIPYIGNDEDILNNKNKYQVDLAVLCIAGNIKIRNKRNQLIQTYLDHGFTFPPIISSNAKIDQTVVFESGVLVFDDVFIDFETVIGAYSVINLKVLLGHHTHIGQNCVISPMTIIGGRTQIGNDCFVGINATVNPLITITNDVIVGSGSVVTKNIETEGTYVGNPIKKVNHS
jgi:sugar O-acyltransferase (sialic acid O-acetyltransferase NeuD family)